MAVGVEQVRPSPWGWYWEWPSESLAAPGADHISEAVEDRHPLWVQLPSKPQGHWCWLEPAELLLEPVASLKEIHASLAVQSLYNAIFGVHRNGPCYRSLS